MHEAFAATHKEWDDRIEVCYISVVALREVRSRTSPIVNISPGEPFHRTVSKLEWLTDWYLIRERGVTLFGPPPQTLIEPISKDEFLQAVQAQARAWRQWIEDMHSRKGLAYAILTLCRALYAYRNGEQASKRQAALWAQRELSMWSQLIGEALVWREEQRDEPVDQETISEIKRFVSFVIDQIAG